MHQREGMLDSLLYTKQEAASIWEAWLSLRHLCTQYLQIPVEGTVVKSLEFDLDSILSPEDSPWQLQERLQAVPGGMSVLGWKIVVADPHAHIRQRHILDHLALSIRLQWEKLPHVPERLHPCILIGSQHCDDGPSISRKMCQEFSSHALTTHDDALEILQASRLLTAREDG